MIAARGETDPEGEIKPEEPAQPSAADQAKDAVRRTLSGVAARFSAQAKAAEAEGAEAGVETEGLHRTIAAKLREAHKAASVHL